MFDFLLLQKEQGSNTSRIAGKLTTAGKLVTTDTLTTAEMPTTPGAENSSDANESRLGRQKRWKPL
jgi:hypothetical protein